MTATSLPRLWPVTFRHNMNSAAVLSRARWGSRLSAWVNIKGKNKGHTGRDKRRVKCAVFLVDVSGGWEEVEGCRGENGGGP